MSQIIRPAPVRRTVTVSASPARAFEVFTAGLHTWWPSSHHIGAAAVKRAVLEPRVGGRWYEQGVDGSECDWGRVLVWEPPSRLVLAWQIDDKWQFNPDLLTEVEVRFISQGPHSTKVELEHRNLERFGEHAEKMRSAFESPDGWPGILQSFVTAVSG